MAKKMTATISWKLCRKVSYGPLSVVVTSLTTGWPVNFFD